MARLLGIWRNGVLEVDPSLSRELLDWETETRVLQAVGRHRLTFAVSVVDSMWRITVGREGETENFSAEDIREAMKECHAWMVKSGLSQDVVTWSMR